MWRPAALAADLAGAWAFQRLIDNGASVTGQATLRPTAAGLLYREDGRMRLPGGAELAAYAAYIFAPNAGGLDILFDEAPPRLFQSFVLSEDRGASIGESEHDCAPDRYRSRLSLEPGGTWTLRHEVSGPRKAYVSRTLYSRPAAPQQV